MEAPELSSSAVAGIGDPFLATENNTCKSGADQFVVEDLLNFPNDDTVGEGAVDHGTGSSTDSSTVTGNDSGNNSGNSDRATSFNGDVGQFSADLCVPYDDMAELEWLSNFVEESFSSVDQQNLHLISGMSSRATDEVQTCMGDGSSPMFHSDMTVPAKARSKRSRAAPCNWASRLLLLSPEASSPEDSADAVIIPSLNTTSPPTLPPQAVVLAVPSGDKKRSTPKKKHSVNSVAIDGCVVARKCLHCLTDTTPQWRTGPMGPKTLCNACGVRYKSGRLVPEYRPASSPTFVLTKHSNSHRKVLELRRQKEMVRAQPTFLPNHHHHGQNNVVYDGSLEEDGYLIHPHVCPDYRHLI